MRTPGNAACTISSSVLEYRLEVLLRKHQHSVDIAKFEKRLLALERKGQEVELIGHKPQPFKVLKERALERFAHHLIQGQMDRRIGVAVSGSPRLKGGHLSLGLSLDIPVGLKLRLSTQDMRTLKVFLSQALERASRLYRAQSHSRPSGPAPRAASRRASTGS